MHFTLPWWSFGARLYANYCPLLWSHRNLAMYLGTCGTALAIRRLRESARWLRAMYKYSLRAGNFPTDSPPGRPPSEVVFFINPKSGSQIAARIFKRDRYTVERDFEAFRYFGASLNCNVRICNLEKNNGEAGFKFLASALLGQGRNHHASKTLQLKQRIWAVACGGDGTFNWVLSQLTEHGLIQRCPLAPVPFGTGNDIARVLKWGSQIVDGDLLSFDMDGVQMCLQFLKRAIPTPFDIWQVSVEVAPGGWCRRRVGGTCMEETLLNGCLRMPMANYFSMGVDARVQYEMELRRTTSRLLNEFMFVWCGILVFFRQWWRTRAPAICDRVQRVEFLDAEGEWRDAKMPGRPQSMIVMNIPSYGGGVNLWGQQHREQTFAPQSFSDGLAELLSVNDIWSLSLQLGFGSARFGGVRQVAQARTLRFTFVQCECDQASVARSRCGHCTCPLHVQVDGEALRICKPVSVTITRMCQALLLRRPAIFPQLPAS